MRANIFACFVSLVYPHEPGIVPGTQQTFKKYLLKGEMIEFLIKLNWGQWFSYSFSYLIFTKSLLSMEKHH